MRQQVRAENLANVNTPGYRARTVNFETALRSARNVPPPGTSLATAAPGLVPTTVMDARLGGELASSFAPTVRPGGGPVDKTYEVGQMMNDNIRYRVLTQQVTQKLNKVKEIISEMGRG